VQTAIRLPGAMHERLKQSAAGVSEEIRRRVERTFAEDDAADAQTRELASDVVWLANKMSGLGVSWQQNERAHSALAAAIAAWLDLNKPKVSGRVPGVTDLFAEQLDPQTVGSMLARELRNIKDAVRKTEQELRRKGSKS
jgi:hypothetical protein